MENIDKTLLEDTTLPNASNIETTDENITIESMFQQGSMPSLGRQIFSVVPIHGPTGAMFNLKTNGTKDGFQLVRAEVAVYPSEAIHTGISQEAIQDIRAQYGKETSQIVGKLLRGLANNQENAKTIEFLNTKCKADVDLQLTDSLNAETNVFEVTQKVHELILKMNNKNLRTYNAFVVIPYKVAAAFMSLSTYVGAENKDERGLFITQIGNTKFYVNPETESTMAYIGLKDLEDSSKSSAIFSPYTSNIIEAQSPDTGEQTYHIFNRFAITASALHETDNEMLYKFNILL